MNETRKQLERLKVAFPGKYVTIKAEIHFHSEGTQTHDFEAYTEDHGRAQGHSVKDAVDRLIAKANGTIEPQDAAEAIDQIEAATIQPTPENEPK